MSSGASMIGFLARGQHLLVVSLCGGEGQNTLSGIILFKDADPTMHPRPPCHLNVITYGRAHLRTPDRWGVRASTCDPGGGEQGDTNPP